MNSDDALTMPMYMPPTTGRHQTLSDEPGTVNKAAETDGWFAKFKVRVLVRTDDRTSTESHLLYMYASRLWAQLSDKAEFEALMDAAAYKKHTEKA